MNDIPEAMSEGTKGPNLSTRIRVSYIIAAVVAGMIIGAYVVAMVFVYRLTDAGDPAAWGQFGDYIGGLLNPIMAALAFYWLTQSIRLQDRELSETRKALRLSAEAQQEQAQHAEDTAKINALAALLSSFGESLKLLHEQHRALLLRRDQAIVAAKNSYLLTDDPRVVNKDPDVASAISALEANALAISRAETRVENLRKSLTRHWEKIHDRGVLAAAQSTD